MDEDDREAVSWAFDYIPDRDSIDMCAVHAHVLLGVLLHTKIADWSAEKEISCGRNGARLEQPSEDAGRQEPFVPAVLTQITESALMGELATSLDILTRLRMKGIELSIDDFGTGYSSLSQLHRIPFTELKIDKSFVMKMQQESEARAIVKTCIMLGHELNMQVVAEGVETKDTFDSLKAMGCDIAQGYFISRPLPAEALLHWASNLQSHV